MPVKLIWNNFCFAAVRNCVHPVIKGDWTVTIVSLFRAITGMITQKKGGGPISFLQKVYGLTCLESVAQLPNGEQGQAPINIAAKAMAEKYAKILAKTIISPDGDSSSRGQTVFFYDAAEGLLTSVSLLLAEFLPTRENDGSGGDAVGRLNVFSVLTL